MWQITKNKSVEGLIILEGDRFEDHRGIIYSLIDKDIYSELPDNLNFEHVKINTNSRGVIRGFHGDNKTWKMVSVISGSVQQVVIDMRKTSQTFGNIFEKNLSEYDNTFILIPPGVANGFQSLESKSIYCYSLSYEGEYADVGEQFTINPNENEFFTNWKLNNRILSNRDKNA